MRNHNPFNFEESSIEIMEKTGISVKETDSGLQLNLDGLMFKKIAQEWEQGKFKPFYSHLKNFIKDLEQDY